MRRQPFCVVAAVPESRAKTLVRAHSCVMFNKLSNGAKGALCMIVGGLLMTIQDGQVPFRMVQGRVYHENFQVVIGDVIIRTRGSVGQDQTLDMVADIPIQEKWLDGVVAQVMRGQTLQVPIRGTLQQPDVDKRVFEQLARQLLSAPAQQVIQDQIFRGLNKLFE